MIRFSKLGAPGQSLVRKFRFSSSGHAGVMLDVTLEYTPPETLNEQLDKEQTRIVGQRKYGAPEDLSAINRATTAAWHMILASRVRRVEGLTMRKLSGLVSVDPSQVDLQEYDREIPLDPSDATELTLSDEERAAAGIPKEVKTAGQNALQNIFYLVNASHEFREFIGAIIKDVSYFQDKDWEKQLKNSGTGASSSSVAL